MENFSDLVNQIAEVLKKKESAGSGDYSALNSDSGARGAYQIMPSNWSNWAQNAGLGSNAEWTPENQDRVAKKKISDYLAQFGGDPAKVFTSWYAGPGWANTPLDQLDGSEGDYPSVKSYVMDGMKRLGLDTYDARVPQYEEMKTFTPDINMVQTTYDQPQQPQSDIMPQLNKWLQQMLALGGMKSGNTL